MATPKESHRIVLLKSYHIQVPSADPPWGGKAHSLAHTEVSNVCEKTCLPTISLKSENVIESKNSGN